MLRHRLALLTFACALPVVLTACSEKTQSDPRTESPLVRVAILKEASMAPRAFTGTVAARVQSDLGFRVAGKVLERFVDAGQPVKRGQPLMRIDPADLKLAAQAQREAVTAARAQAKQTADEELRYRNLRSSGAISASNYDQIKAAADSAKARLSAAEAQAEVAVNATRYADLVADADGIVMETLAEPGQVVSAGQVVVRVAHAGPREAVVQLPENLRPRIGSTAQATLFGNQNLDATTRLRQLSDVADRQTRTFEARYVLEGEMANAPLGTTITVKIPSADAVEQNVLQVPISALYDAGKGPGIWAIKGDPTQVYWTPVTVRHLDDEYARISTPLRPGAPIVALGAHLLHEAQPVRVSAPAAVSVAESVQP
ncbi:efflux RND transporter periplasmic adaptor subunit [Pseudomonas cannabina]|uniref:RND family efflux transporter MFP subunit n=1 Tax=Pseudomonas cannabina TaxID=86840 RepID=A0A0P9NBJ4_PSECA|nr:efflux RND transporter periplasmic adaptor subunit [Pseudomonas cannabina]KAA8704260.1 efflux RND transporter periplasmic adaptor subunit [Pseudomonas cannabina]KPW81080.1 RND family efflux transporter MFP subunit [Pseudomonas cannabina]RMN21006.1 RND family efflux transporter MFP subunit [Pseudomonas cannabina]SDR29913.1 RND family efflux transporter, MFP subunit [Pseudomonas cannabina]